MPRNNSKENSADDSGDSSKKSLDEKKAEALNLFEEEEKKSTRKPKVAASEAEQGSVYGHLGKEDPAGKISELKKGDADSEEEVVE